MLAIKCCYSCVYCLQYQMYMMTFLGILVHIPIHLMAHNSEVSKCTLAFYNVYVVCVSMLCCIYDVYVYVAFFHSGKEEHL